jgi:hypothetical protein
VLKREFLYTEYEALPATVARANQWVSEAGLKVFNVETVVLPNIYLAQDASKTRLRTSGNLDSNWHQIVRVWYEVPNPSA